MRYYFVPVRLTKINSNSQMPERIVEKKPLQPHRWQHKQVDGRCLEDKLTRVTKSLPFIPRSTS